MDCPPIPQFYLNILLRSITYPKERPPSANIANRDFLPSSKPEDMVRLVYIHYYKVQIMLLHSGLQVHDVTHALSA